MLGREQGEQGYWFSIQMDMGRASMSRIGIDRRHHYGRGGYQENDAGSAQKGEAEADLEIIRVKIETICEAGDAASALGDEACGRAGTYRLLITARWPGRQPEMSTHRQVPLGVPPTFACERSSAAGACSMSLRDGGTRYSGERLDGPDCTGKEQSSLAATNASPAGQSKEKRELGHLGPLNPPWISAPRSLAALRLSTHGAMLHAPCSMLHAASSTLMVSHAHTHTHTQRLPLFCAAEPLSTSRRGAISRNGAQGVRLARSSPCSLLC